MGKGKGEGKRVDGEKGWERRGLDWEGGWERVGGEKGGERWTRQQKIDPLTGGPANKRSADGLRLRTNRNPEDRVKDGEAQGHIDLEIRRFQMKPSDLWAKMALIFWIG